MLASSNNWTWANRPALNVFSDTDDLSDTVEDRSYLELNQQDERMYPVEPKGGGSGLSRLRPQKHKTNAEGRCHCTDQVGYYFQHLSRRSFWWNALRDSARVQVNAAAVKGGRNWSNGHEEVIGTGGRCDVVRFKGVGGVFMRSP